MSRRRQRFKRLLPLLVVVVLAAAGTEGLRHLGRWLSHPDPLRRVDVLVVTPGAPDRRLPRAVGLLRRGLAGQVWVVTSASGPVLREPEAVEAYARANGAGGRVVVLAKHAQSMVRDARIVAARARRTGVRSLAVLGAPVELARIRLVFGRVAGIGVLAWSDGSRYRADRWWRTDRYGTPIEGLKYVAALSLVGPSGEIPRGGVPPALPLRAALGGALGALAAGALCRPLARRLGLVAVPRLWRAHASPTPMLGGLAILGGLGAGVVAAGGVRLGAVGAAAGLGVAVIALVGLVDDITGLGAFARLLWAAAAGSLAWLLGLRTEVFVRGNPAGEFGNAVLTLAWFVGVTQAVNFVDNIDGAAGGVGAASAAAIALTAVLGGQYVVAVAAAALAGGCVGFLVHNVAPARLFMGDLGALGLGFALAALALALRPATGPPLSAAVPVLALGVPIFDVSLVVCSRLRAGRSPLVGGTDHTAHRLLARGTTVRRTAGVLWGVQAFLGGAAVLVARLAPPFGWAIVAAVAVAALVLLLALLRLPPWRPPAQLRASQRLVMSIERAVGALAELEAAAGDQGVHLSDPTTTRSLKDALRGLERLRHLLGPNGPE